MDEFLELVTERPDTKLWKKGIFCPYCNSKEVENSGTSTTLVGYFGKDMNHTHTHCTCNECGKKFTRETKGFDNVWFTDPHGKVLLGIPYCFESYIYTCKYCGGDVVRVWFDVTTNEQTKPVKTESGQEYFVLSNKVSGGKSTPNQYPVFKCKQCGEEIKSENEHMYAS